MKPLVIYDNYEISDTSSFLNVRRIIFEINDNLFYTSDEKEKIEDITSMPDYIKEDWFNYNKTPLTTTHIDCIINLASKSPALGRNNKLHEETQILLHTLKSIRRDLIIREVK